MAPSSSSTRRYAAFISYSHKDNREENRRWANWVQESLESYEVPRGFQGKTNKYGEPIPPMIFPVFRDESELAADSDLQNSIRQALEHSQQLIVICSPRAVASAYVTEEIRAFKELGKADRIIGLLVEGEPGDPQHECLPQPLRLGRMSAQGVLDWTAPAEPICADVRLPGTREQGYTSVAALRESIQGRRATTSPEMQQTLDDYRERLESARLKLIAGVLGVPLGDLIRSDNKFRLARLRRAVAIGITIAAALLLFAAIAYSNRVSKLQTDVEISKVSAESSKVKAENLEKEIRLNQERQINKEEFDKKISRAKENLEKAEIYQNEKMYALAESLIQQAVLDASTRVSNEEKYQDFIADHDRKRDQLLIEIQAAIRDLKDEEKLNQAFAEVVFLSTPLILPGADKQADRERAREAAAKACATLPPPSAGNSLTKVLRDPTSFHSRLAYLNRVAGKNPAATADDSASGSAFDRGLECLLNPLDNPADDQLRFAKARGLFEKELNASPEHFWARFTLSALQLRDRQFLTAEAGLSTCENLLQLPSLEPAAVQSSPKEGWLFLLRGLARIHLGKYSLAEADLEKSLGKLPETEAYGRYLTEAYLADILTRQRLYQQADAKLAPLLNQAGINDPTAAFHAALNDILWAEKLKQDGDFATATAVLMRGKTRLGAAIEREPNRGEFRLVRGGLFMNDAQGNEGEFLDLAIEDLKIAVNIAAGETANSADAFTQYAEALYRRGKRGGPAFKEDFVQALQALDHAVKLAARDVEARLLRASILIHIADATSLAILSGRELSPLEEAHQDAQAVIQATPPPSGQSLAIAWSLSARSAEGLGNYSDAWIHYGQALKLYDPNLTLEPAERAAKHPDAREIWLLRRGWVGMHNTVRAWDQSCADFEVLIARKPEDPYLWAGLALAYLRCRDQADALTLITHARAVIEADLRSAQPRFDREIARRVFHAHADICANLSIPPKKPTSSDLRVTGEYAAEAVGSLRKSLDLTGIARHTKAAVVYWNENVRADEDLRPLRGFRAFESLHHDFLPPPLPGSAGP